MGRKTDSTRDEVAMGRSTPERVLVQVQTLSVKLGLEPADLFRETIELEFEVVRATPVDVPHCPRCGSSRVVRMGVVADARPRFRCEGCGRTFTMSTLSVLSGTRIPEETWLAFAQGMSDGMSLRELSGALGISLKTSWTMRARLLKAVGRDLADYERRPYLTGELDV